MATSMLSPENQIEVVRGTSKNFALTVVDEHGEAVNLTGARVIATVKCDIYEVNPNVSKDSNVGVGEVEIETQSGDTVGKATIKFNPSDTQTMDPGEYIFDVWVVLSSGARHIVVGPAPFIVKRGVTVLS